MPTLPCPPLPPGVPLDGGDLPVSSVDDVSAEWAPELQQLTAQPVLEAIQQGQEALFLEYQRQSRYAACQSDPVRATDEYLEGIGADEYGCFKQQSETDTAYRARIFKGPAVVDPNDVVAAANAVLAPYTSISCRYAERSDAWFSPIRADDTWQMSHAYLFGATIASGGFIFQQTNLIGTSGGSAPAFSTVAVGGSIADNTAAWLCTGAAPPTPVWTSHVFEAADGGGPLIVPNYPDRLYPGAPLPAGATQYVPNRRPPGAMMNAEPYGRWFLLRAPDISLVDSTVAGLYTSILDGWAGTHAYLFGAVITTGNGFYYQQTALSGTSSGGAPTFPTTTGASVNDGTAVWLCLGTAPVAPNFSDGTSGFFVGGGSSATNTTYLFSITSTVNDIYNALVGAVTAVVGQGVRWSFEADPGLTA